MNEEGGEFELKVIELEQYLIDKSIPFQLHEILHKSLKDLKLAAYDWRNSDE